MPSSEKTKIVFMGSSDFAVASLDILLGDSRFEVMSVFTQPDRKVGRKREIKFTPVKERALEVGLTVYQPEKSREIFQLLEGQKIDFIVVVAYGHIIRQKVIDLPKYDILNIHGSLLPAYRGASPIHAALANGDEKAGVCVMRMVKELDAGSVYKCASVQVEEDDDFASLHDKLAELGAGLLIPVLRDIVELGVEPKAQDETEASFCSKIVQEDAKLDFATMTSVEIKSLQKAYKYWPKLWFEFRGKKIKLLDFEVYENSFAKIPSDLLAGSFFEDSSALFVVVLNGYLELKTIQPESKRAMSVADFLRGNPGYFQE